MAVPVKPQFEIEPPDERGQQGQFSIEPPEGAPPTAAESAPAPEKFGSGTDFENTLGREIKSTASAMNPYGIAKGLYHSFTDEPTNSVERSAATPAGKLGLGLYRSVAQPISIASQYYGNLIKHPELRNQAATDMLSVAPEAMGQGAGAVLGAKALESAPRIPQAMKTLGAETRGKLAQKIVGPLTYENVGETGADVRSGANPERGLVNEGLVGTKKGLVEKSGARLEDLKNSANSILENHPNSRQVINAEPLIDQAINDAVANAKKVGGDTSRLEGIRKALKTEYGKLHGTPREMNDLKAAIQDSADQLGAYKNTQPLEASAANAMKDAARRLKDEVNTRVPEAAEINQRMQDLSDARSGIQRKVNQSRGDDIFDSAGHVAGPLSKLAQRTIGSAPVRTGIARMLNYGNVKGVPEVAPYQGHQIRGLLKSAPTELGSHMEPIGQPSAPPPLLGKEPFDYERWSGKPRPITTLKGEQETLPLGMGQMHIPEPLDLPMLSREIQPHGQETLPLGMGSMHPNPQGFGEMTPPAAEMKPLGPIPELPPIQKFNGGGGSVRDADVMSTINNDIDRRFGKPPGKDYKGPERRSGSHPAFSEGDAHRQALEQAKKEFPNADPYDLMDRAQEIKKMLLNQK